MHHDTDLPNAFPVCHPPLTVLRFLLAAGPARLRLYGLTWSNVRRLIIDAMYN